MITTPVTEEHVHGTPYLENTAHGLRPHRLPPHVRYRDADGQLAFKEAQPSGVRLEFTTEATHIAIELHATRMTHKGMERARGVLDFIIDGDLHISAPLSEGDTMELDLTTGAQALLPGGPDLVSVDDVPIGEKRVEIWLPHNEQVDLIAIHTDAEVRAVERAADRRRWLHHGSSISHGSNATAPTGIWPVVAARRADVNLQNLGFGNSAMVDPFMARLIRDTPAELISVKLGINVVNLDAMKLRIFTPAVHGFLDTIRDGHPETPLLLVSPIHCEIHEETPGPGGIDPTSFETGNVKYTATGERGDTAFGRLTLQVIRRALTEVVAARSDDPNLHFLDGLELYGENDAQSSPLPDNLHPDSQTHSLIGERFAAAVFGEDGPFAAEPR